MFSRLKPVLLNDVAENSIMQTITIAVSAILIAAGLVTAPGLINNARDNNAKTDLANIAYAQEFVMASVGRYMDFITPEQEKEAYDEANAPATLDIEDAQNNLLWMAKNLGVNGLSTTVVRADGGVSFTLSGGVEHRPALTCEEDGKWAYLLRADSQSGKAFFRSSSHALVSNRVSDTDPADCILVHPGYADFILVDNEDEDDSDPGNGTPDALAFTANGDLGSILLGETSDSFAIETNAPQGAEVTFVVTDGSLPTGMTLENGVISGTPTAAGTFEFTVQATANGVSVSEDFSIEVVLSQVTGWSMVGASRAWDDIATSSSGEKAVASAGGVVYYTTDYGVTWNIAPGVSSNNGPAYVDISASGTQMIAAGYGGARNIWRSNNSGATWTLISGLTDVNNNYARGVSLSPNGSYATVVFSSETHNNNYYYLISGFSTSPSVSYNVLANTNTLKPNAVDISDTGRFVITNSNGSIYRGDAETYTTVTNIQTISGVSFVEWIGGNNWVVGKPDGSFATSSNNVGSTNSFSNAGDAGTSLTSLANGFVVADGKLYSTSGYGTFTDVTPNDNVTFRKVAVGSSGVKYLIQSGTGQLWKYTP